MIAATQQPRERLCTACFTGKYPIALPGADKLGKNLLERTDLGGLPTLGHRLRPGAEFDASASDCLRAEAGTAVWDDPADKAGATGCDPGPTPSSKNAQLTASPPIRKSLYDLRLPRR